ncbi:MAG TPA: DNA polymerase III subunit alpha, partial [Syntrophomonas sp.]|nr:DNA polymerase III subunit alpha [Syntrophomonas sp.]
MESFAGYGFNKSHSAAYAMISYETAYLKTHYPVEYMCAFLSSVIDNQDRVVFYLKECQKMQIQVLPPDINESYENFTVAGGKIRFGLGAIKNVGINAVKNIVESRKQGAFTSLFNFCQQVDLAHINKRMVENFILAGCFDSLGITRKQALSIMDECIELALQIKQSQSSQQLSLFGDITSMVEEPRPRVKGELESKDLLSREKEVLGFFVSANPLDEHRDILPLLTTCQVADLEGNVNYTYVRVAGTVINLTRRVSRRGDSYARFILEDLSGRMEVMVFPSAYRRNADNLESDRVVVMEGYLDTREEQHKISLRRVQPVPSDIKELNIRIDDDNDTSDKRDAMLKLIKKYSGEQEVILHFPGRRALVLNDNLKVRPHIELKEELALLFGRENIWFA